MAIYPKTHSEEWFAALTKFNPVQAVQTRQTLEMMGRDDVCSVCGDDPAHDYRLLDVNLPPDAVGTFRLCDGCRFVRSSLHGETYEPLTPQ
jgi:hypothetical protein